MRNPPGVSQPDAPKDFPQLALDCKRKALTMTVSMYTVSIPVFIQHLNGLNTVLDKAAAWAAARKVNEADLLNMRLSPDMFNLARQVRAAIDHAANAAGRLSGKELLKFANDETTIAQLKDRIAKTASRGAPGDKASGATLAPRRADRPRPRG